MKYPKRFIKKVMLAFPDIPSLHERLKDGNNDVGIFLGNAQYSTGEGALKYTLAADELVDRIAEAFKQKDMKEMKRIIKRHITIAKLYEEWEDLYDKYVGADKL